MVRLGIYGAWGNQIEKKHSSGSSGYKPQQRQYQHLGLPPEFGRVSHEAVLGTVLSYFNIEPNWPKYERQFHSPLGIPSARAQRDAKGHIDPEVPPPSRSIQSPQAAPPAPSGQVKKIDPIQGIQTQPEKLDVPDGLT